MKVLIVGSGLIGLTSAYILHKRGHQVMIIDRAAGPGLETSFANGGLLTPSMSDPWNSPGSWRMILRSLGRSDAPLQLRLRMLPFMASWGIQFIRYSRPLAFERNILTNLRLGLYSLRVLESIRQETKIDYGRSARGTLRVFRDQKSLCRASAAANQIACEGLQCRRLTREQIIELEPALAPIANELAGSLHYTNDETGDAYQFCTGLANYLRHHGVEFRFNTEAFAFQNQNGHVATLTTSNERLVADRYIVAAGSYSAPLLRSAGLSIPVKPVKGYSITIDTDPNELQLQIPVVDDELHAVITPLHGALRVAGTAEFAGFDRQPNKRRTENLVKFARRILPRLRFNPDDAKPWSGLRAVSADGVPIIGVTPIANLFANTGHGHLGWTMAAGSSQLLVDIISGQTPSIDPAPYSLARFLT